jgi:hypothetical protein
MIRRMFLILPLVALMAVGSFAQARRTVTNSDLEGYRQQRVAAEQDLQQNYARMGFASPEEQARRNAESQQQLIALSRQLKAERLEQDRMDLQRDQLTLIMSAPAPSGYYDNSGDLFYPTYLGSGGGLGRGVRGRTQQGYFGGGQFWPQGSRTPARPAIVQPRAVPHH